MEDKIEYNGFIYHIQIDQVDKSIKVNIEHKMQQPAYLCKYYSLNKNSVDAVLNQYLYASHPNDLNDKYDCSPYLIDFSKCDLEFYLQKIKAIESLLYGKRTLNDETITNYYNSPEKWRLERYIADMNRQILFCLFGTISLSSEEDSILMWSHYSQNNGFMIKINTSMINNKNLFGPFPINYCDTLHKISCNPSVPIISVLYQSNIKSEIWSYEKEWRYLYYNPNIKDHTDKRNRKLFYNENALVEIVLGYNFFEPASSIKRYADFDILTLKTKHKNYKLKRKLLNFIVKSNMRVFLIHTDIRKFSLIKNEIFIEKIGSNTFKIKYNII